MFYALFFCDLTILSYQYFFWFVRVVRDSITAKPYILQKILFQLIFSKFFLLWLKNAIASAHFGAHLMFGLSHSVISKVIEPRKFENS